VTRPGTGVLVLLLAAVVRLAVAAAVPLHPDEAYYWEWSRHLSAGYFDHPPVIALFIRAGTALLGDTPLGVRLWPVLSGLAAGWAVMRLASNLADRAAGNLAALTFVALPVMSGVFLLATPDAPLLAFAALALLALERAMTAAAPASAFRWWLVTGFACGAAMASKYTGIVLPFGLLAGILASASSRPVLRTAGPWAAVLVASLVMWPVLYWNALHDWSSFRFQLEHGLGNPVGGAAWRRELELLGGQALLASPVLFVLGVAAVARAARGGDRVQRVLAAVAISAAALFAYSALRRRVEANWPALAWVPIATLLGTSAFAGASVTWRRIGLAMGFIGTAVLYLQSVTPVVPIAARRDPTARAYGWADLATAVDATMGSAQRRPWVAADRYQDAAELAFLLPAHPTVFSLNLGGRDNQYRYWPAFRDSAQAGDDLLLVLADRPAGAVETVIEALTPFFGSVERGEPVVMRRGTAQVGSRRLWLLRDWKGAWPAPRQ
jgi:4-amino-4-deoxy-L-arabinose transferase-like glycosyltransferase